MTDPYEPDDQAEDEQSYHARMVAAEVRKMHVRDDARAIYAAGKRPPAAPFDAGTLAEILARPDDPPARIEGLLPWDAAMLLVAQRKTGKTTLVANMARSLLTGEPFLDRCHVRKLDGDIAFLNYEVSGGQLARWARDVGVPEDRLYLVNLRGRRNPLNDPEDRALLASTLRARGVETVICDPFGRAFTGASQNDAGEVQSFLVSLDLFARGEVGARDVILTAHAGWNGERSRGSSALEDWADSVVTMTRDPDDEHGARYLSAIGRDVDLEEDRLEYDPDSRRLSLAGVGSRKHAATRQKAGDLQTAVFDLVVAEPGINGSEVEQKLRDQGVTFQRGDHRKALQSLVDQYRITFTPGPKNSKCYSEAVSPDSPALAHGLTEEPDSPDSPQLAHGSPSLLAQPVPIGRANRTADRTTPVSPPSPTVCGRPDCGSTLVGIELEHGYCWPHTPVDVKMRARAARSDRPERIRSGIGG